MEAFTNIEVDLTAPRPYGPWVYAVQGDSNTRGITVALFCSKRPWNVPEDAEVAMKYRLPSGAKGLYNLLPDGTPAVSIQGNRITILFTATVLCEPGTVQAAVVINNKALDQLTTFPFAIVVKPNAFACDQKAEDYIRLQWLENKLDECLMRAKDSGLFDGSQGVPGRNGSDGAPGPDGAPGRDGVDGQDGYTPVKGVDYFTPEEVSSIEAGAVQKAEEVVSTELDQIRSDISNVVAELGRTEVENLIYNHYDAPKTYSVNINGANPTFDQIAKNDGGIPVQAGSRYLVHYDVVFDPISTIQQGSINIQFRENGTSTTVNAIESGSPWTFDAYSSKGKTFGEFICSFDSDQMVYLFLFGTGGVAGTELHFTVSNFYMVEITEDTPEDYIRRSFGSIYIAEAETYLRVTGFDRRITALENGSAANTIVCWGDSLTMGAGSGDYNRNTYPAILGTKLPDFEVVNYGVGGETSDTIMGRQGSAPMLVNPFTVPADTSAVEVTISTDSNVPMCPLMQMSLEDKGLNPCAIGGILGNLSYSDGKYYFTRVKSGESLEISRPQMIITNAMQKDMLRSPYCMIIWVGTNDGYSGDEGASPLSEAITLKTKINRMVDYAGCKRYIVLGLVEGQRSKWETINKFLGFAFGEHYINIREYLCAYGLDDNEIAPTDTDVSNLSIGRVPQSIRSDGLHLNQSGYSSVANAVFERGKQLGYW